MLPGCKLYVCPKALSRLGCIRKHGLHQPAARTQYLSSVQGESGVRLSSAALRNLSPYHVILNKVASKHAL